MLWTIITLGSGLVLVMMLARAVQIWRQEENAPRGTAPGQGHITIESHYISGGGGGGNSITYTVPRDPQEYAKAFVPKERKD